MRSSLRGERAEAVVGTKVGTKAQRAEKCSLLVDARALQFDNRVVPDVIEPAKSGRANCRGCGRSIARGELRFGEASPNLFGEGESISWYHLVCAACMRPSKLGPVLDAYFQTVPERDWLRRAVTEGLEHERLPRLMRAERAASGSAHCRECRELIAKGTWRIALQMFEEGRMQPLGTIHVHCAEAYFGTPDIIDRIERLTPGLTRSDVDEIDRLSHEAHQALQA